MYRQPQLFEGKIFRLVIALSAPTGWLLYQHHAGGRYTLGTSLDGFNLHMGNSPNFLRDYPPAPDGTLDNTADQLNAGHHFSGEWDLYDYHQHAAIEFIKTHPRQTMRGEVRKFDVIFFSVRKVGAWAHHGVMSLIEDAGILHLDYFSGHRLPFPFLVCSPIACLRGPGPSFFRSSQQSPALHVGFRLHQAYQCIGLSHDDFLLPCVAEITW